MSTSCYSYKAVIYDKSSSDSLDINLKEFQNQKVKIKYFLKFERINGKLIDADSNSNFLSGNLRLDFWGCFEHFTGLVPTETCVDIASYVGSKDKSRNIIRKCFATIVSNSQENQSSRSCQ